MYVNNVCSTGTQSKSNSFHNQDLVHRYTTGQGLFHKNLNDDFPWNRLLSLTTAMYFDLEKVQMLPTRSSILIKYSEYTS